MRKRKGFTLVELMVVAIIVAILAAVAIPLMSGNKNRAYGTEAEAALGMVRSNLRVYYAEYDKYPLITSGTLVEGSVKGINAGDLLGTYFSGGNYSVVSSDTTDTYTITCKWDVALGATAATNNAPQGGKVQVLSGFWTSLDQDGKFLHPSY